MGGWHNKLLVIIYDYDIIDTRWVVGLHSWWLSSTITTKKRSSTGVNFSCNFEVGCEKNSSSESKNHVEKKVMIKTLVRADMLERTGILITEDMSRRDQPDRYYDNILSLLLLYIMSRRARSV